MSNKWLLQRAAILLGLTVVINGVIAFFTYVEEDEPCESGQPQGARPGVGAGWGQVLPLPPRQAFSTGPPQTTEGNGFFVSPWN